MDAQTWKRVQGLFAAAMELPEGERDAFLSRGEVDAEIRARVLSLLQSDADPATVLGGLAEDLLDTAVAGSSDAGGQGDEVAGRRIGPYRAPARTSRIKATT
jgi:hypothetical protein